MWRAHFMNGRSNTPPVFRVFDFALRIQVNRFLRCFGFCTVTMCVQKLTGMFDNLGGFHHLLHCWIGIMFQPEPQILTQVNLLVIAAPSWRACRKQTRHLRP